MSVWTIVSRREFVERARDRGFAISTAITLVILVGIIVVSAIFDRGTRFDLATVGEGSREVARDVAAAARLLDVEVRVAAFDDLAPAESAVDAGDVDAVIVSGERLLVRGEPNAQLVALIQAASIQRRTRAALLEAGLSGEQIDAVLAQGPLPVESVEPVDPRRRELGTVAFVGVLALYGQLFAYGYWVAAGVVEEKSSRVVEVLLSTVRPSELLRGKIFGIGFLGLLQLLLIAVVALAVSMAIGRLEFPSGALEVAALVLFWFVLGFFFYASLFAVAGAIVTRQEDLQSTMTPLTIAIVASFFIGIAATGNPSSTLATLASILPFSSPLVMPTRIVLGEAELWEVGFSIVLSVASTALLIPIATKVYARAVLQPGRVKVRQMLRSA
ncbi:MAG TPA: ABC transporter permease [Actinomycetota bacterium]|nr:ABC transporter permease [Actinomycetota bacterium]